jgi:hypothetical protein
MRGVGDEETNNIGPRRAKRFHNKAPRLIGPSVITVEARWGGVARSWRLTPPFDMRLYIAPLVHRATHASSMGGTMIPSRGVRFQIEAVPQGATLCPRLPAILPQSRLSLLSTI